MAKPLDQLMEKEMTRGEFLATVALGLASLTGFSSLIHLLTGKRNPLQQSSSSGYGSSSYGGK